MKKTFAKIVSLLCALTLVFTAMPFAALAEETKYHIYCDGNCIAVFDDITLAEEAKENDYLKILFIRQEGSEWVSTVPAGQYVAAVLADESDVTVNEEDSFVMPAHDVHFHVLFGEKAELEVDLSSGEAGIDNDMLDFMLANLNTVGNCFDLDEDGTGDIRYATDGTLTVTEAGRQLHFTNGIYQLNVNNDDKAKFSKIILHLPVDTTTYYTITWLDYQGRTLAIDERVAEGTVPVYPGETPTMPSDNTNSFVFTGWSPTVVAAYADATYKAQFAAQARTRTVIWKNYDGTVLLQKTGMPISTDMPDYDGPTPTKPRDEKYDYHFMCWEVAYNKTTYDMICTALYFKSPYVRTITWMSEGKVLLVSKDVPVGQPVTYSGTTPTKKSDGKYKYTFSGWTNVVNNTTEDMVCTAKFAKTPIPISLTVPSKKTFKAKTKTKKISVTLKIDKKAVKGKKLTLKVHGRTYTAKTNSKGVATFKIKLTKKNTYKYTVSYKGNPKNVSKSGKIIIK